MAHLWLVFAVGTAICWGAYGPAIHEGQMGLNRNAWKAFLLVGVAYFVVAVLVPLMIIKLGGDDLKFQKNGAVYSLVAGVLGALGALSLIAALRFQGNPLYVMPLVFGLAPVVNVLVHIFWKPPAHIHPMLYVGFAVLAAGAGLVLYYKPTH